MTVLHTGQLINHLLEFNPHASQDLPVHLASLSTWLLHAQNISKPPIILHIKLGPFMAPAEIQPMPAAFDAVLLQDSG
jgi:hypothetical protein